LPGSKTQEHKGWEGHEEKVFLGKYEEKKDLLIIGDGWGSIL